MCKDTCLHCPSLRTLYICSHWPLLYTVTTVTALMTPSVTHTPVFLFTCCQIYIWLDILTWFLMPVCLTCLSHCISTSRIVFYYWFWGHNYQYFQNQILTWNSNLNYQTTMIKSKDNIQTRGYTATTVKAHRQITQLHFKHNRLQTQQVQHYLP
jgi:hypothetical protein